MRRRTLLALAGAEAWTALPRPAAAADLRAVVDATRASVLALGSFRATDNPRFGFRGSGFVVGDGTLLVTCFHVVPAAAERIENSRFVARVGRGLEAQAEVRSLEVVASDRVRDLAVLRIDGPPLPALKLAAPGSAREGQSVALMGFPLAGALGFTPVTHRGIVSAITTATLPAPTARQLDPATVQRMRSGNFELLQLDATAYPGNSGGPLLDAESGLVVGIVSMVVVKAGREAALGQPSGIAYAVPVAPLHALLAGR